MTSSEETARFLERASDYGAVGLFISEVSDFELAMDKLIFEFARKRNNEARAYAKRFPRTSISKLEFVVKIWLNDKELRVLPIFNDGGLDMNFFCYSAEEVFDVRNHVAHGAIGILSLNETKTWFEASKLKTDGKRAEIQRFRYPVGLMAELAENASTLRRYCSRLREFLIGDFCPEAQYQHEKRKIETQKRLFSEGWVSPLMVEFSKNAVGQA